MTSSTQQTAPFRFFENGDFEQVVFCSDRKSGLRAIIAVHSTALGPALGGCRFFDYPDEDSALRDVLNLACAMTYKAALAGLALGGGKAVIMGNPYMQKTDARMGAFGHFVDRLGGTYITTEDSGTTAKDMDLLRTVTKHVTGSSEGSGDPSPVTAVGVFEGIRAAAQAVFGSTQLSGRRIALQGVGNVGFRLAQHLKGAGASLVVADRNKLHLERAAKELGAEVVQPAEIASVKCDIFSPCAMGGAINEETIPDLRCAIVAGAANNQLASDEAGDLLAKRGIAYVPDFAINAGGLISVAGEVMGYDRDEALQRTREIYQTVSKILTAAAEERISPHWIALRLAQERLARAATLNL